MSWVRDWWYAGDPDYEPGAERPRRFRRRPKTEPPKSDYRSAVTDPIIRPEPSYVFEPDLKELQSRLLDYEANLKDHLAKQDRLDARRNTALFALAGGGCLLVAHIFGTIHWNEVSGLLIGAPIIWGAFNYFDAGSSIKQNWRSIALARELVDDTKRRVAAGQS